MSLLKAENIVKSYQDGKELKLTVLKGINIEIEKGEKIAIVGASGCGKSTLINILGLLVPMDKGNLIVDNQEVNKLKQKDIAAMRNSFFGYIVQDFALIEGYTAMENVEIPLLYSKKKLSLKERNKHILSALEKVGLKHKATSKVKNLSGGQRQRVAIARAIVNNPKILLADEPTGALDTETSDAVMKVLDSLIEEGLSLLLVTHNKDIASLCDKIYSIDNGLLSVIIG